MDENDALFGGFCGFLELKSDAECNEASVEIYKAVLDERMVGNLAM